MEKNQAKTTCLSRFTDSKQRRCGRLLQRLATFLVLFLCSMTMSWAQRTATGSNGKLILKDAKSPAITLNSNGTSILQLSFTIKVIDDNEEQPGTSLVTYYTTDGSDPEDSSNGNRKDLQGKNEVTVTVTWEKGDIVKVRAFTMRIDDSDATNYDGSKEATQDYHNTGDTALPCVDDPVIIPGDQAVVADKLEVTIKHDQWTEATKDKLQIYYRKYERDDDDNINHTEWTKADELPLTLTLDKKSGSVQAYAKFTDNGKEVEYDKVSRTYILLDGATTYLNKNDTKPVGTIVDKKVDKKGTTMTMTYGGIADETDKFTRFTNVDYSEDNILGSLHAVTNTTLYLNKDAMSEKSEIEYYSHKKASRQKLHERTFGLPARGSFYKFEPEANGELTVFVEQQGAMPKSQGELYTSYVRKRPVYFLDEAGNSIQATYAYTSSKINKADWEKIQETPFTGSDAEFMEKLNAYYKGIINGENTTFTNINSAVAEADDKRKALTLGTSIQPIIVLNEECNEGILEEDKNYDKTGYMTISEGYVTYRFPVKAGKTYYLFASGTKLALSGFTFKKDKNYETENLQSVTLDGNADNTTTIDGLTEGNQYNVTLKNRSFGNGKWYALVLPFSVSQKQMKSVFGEGVKVLHYNNVTGSTLNLFEHYYQMIVGGTPVLVKPSKDVANPVFNNVTLTSKVVVEMEYNDFKCTGSWDNVDFPEYSYFINAKDSKFYLYDPKVAAGKTPHAGAFRTWIISTSNTPATAKKLTMRINGIEDNNETTAIWNAVIGNDDNAEVASKGIYNLSGQKMNVTDTRSLSKGIYIVNGKKYIVK